MNEFNRLSQKNYLTGKLHGEYRLWYGSGTLKLGYFQGGNFWMLKGGSIGTPAPLSGNQWTGGHS